MVRSAVVGGHMLISPTRTQGHRIAKLAVSAREQRRRPLFQLPVYSLSRLARGAGTKRNAEDSAAASAGLRADYHNLPTVRFSYSRFYFYRFLFTSRLCHFSCLSLFFP